MSILHNYLIETFSERDLIGADAGNNKDAAAKVARGFRELISACLHKKDMSALRIISGSFNSDISSVLAKCDYQLNFTRKGEGLSRVLFASLLNLNCSDDDMRLVASSFIGLADHKHIYGGGFIHELSTLADLHPYFWKEGVAPETHFIKYQLMLGSKKREDISARIEKDRPLVHALLPTPLLGVELRSEGHPFKHLLALRALRMLHQPQISKLVELVMPGVDIYDAIAYHPHWRQTVNMTQTIDALSDIDAVQHNFAKATSLVATPKYHSARSGGNKALTQFLEMHSRVLHKRDVLTKLDALLLSNLGNETLRDCDIVSKLQTLKRFFKGPSDLSRLPANSDARESEEELFGFCCAIDMELTGVAEYVIELYNNANNDDVKNDIAIFASSCLPYPTLTAMAESPKLTERAALALITTTQLDLMKFESRLKHKFLLHFEESAHTSHRLGRMIGAFESGPANISLGSAHPNVVALKTLNEFLRANYRNDVYYPMEQGWALYHAQKLQGTLKANVEQAQSIDTTNEAAPVDMSFLIAKSSM